MLPIEEAERLEQPGLVVDAVTTQRREAVDDAARGILWAGEKMRMRRALKAAVEHLQAIEGIKRFLASKKRP